MKKKAKVIKAKNKSIDKSGMDERHGKSKIIPKEEIAKAREDMRLEIANRKGPSMYGSPAKMNNSPMQMKGSWMSKHCSK
jgi:hypothetical protein